MTGLVPCDPTEPAFAEALAEAGLPPCEAQAVCFALAEGGAYGAIEGHGPERLLRSVVVASAHRGQGRATRLIELLAEEAVETGAERLWLLTTSAAPFFAKLGWKAVDRETAPPVIQANDQFSSICPASATLMMRELVEEVVPQPRADLDSVQIHPGRGVSAPEQPLRRLLW